MAIVPKQGNVPKFNSDDIRKIEKAVLKDKTRNAAEIFLDEWSTMGIKRPTLKLLLELLVKVELFKAADYVACNILKQEKPKRPNYGPAAVVDTSDAAINEILDKQMLPQDPFGNLVILESASELTPENSKYPSEKSAKAEPDYLYKELPSEELPVILNNPK